MQPATAIAQARAADSAEVLRNEARHLQHVERRHREDLLERRIRLDDLWCDHCAQLSTFQRMFINLLLPHYAEHFIAM